MSKYNNFENFMSAVINEADNISRNRRGYPLYEAYDAPERVIVIVSKIIDNGWTKFVAVVALLALGPFAFGAAFLAFIGNPIGIALGIALAAYGGVKAIKYLYENRKLPLAIKEVGDRYKSRFEAHRNETSYLDRLIDEAATDLFLKA